MRTTLIILLCLVFYFTACHSTEDTAETTPKNANHITETYWKLKKLKGREVEMAKNQERERYFMLKMKDNRLRGFSGCNAFSGTYELDAENEIHFSQLVSTMKACVDVDVDETIFLNVLKQTEHYTITRDTLRLRKGQGTPLAVFEAVYFN